MAAGGSWPDPRRLGFHVLTVLAIAVCVVAASWQWDRANRTEADAVPDGPVVALVDLDPRSTFSGMRVGISGQFDSEHEVLVEPRNRDGQAGAWVLTPLKPSAGASGSSAPGAADPATTAVAVVRGWVPAGQPPTPAPQGTVEIVGVLVADSRQPDAAVTPTDPPTLTVVDTGALSNHAGYPVRSGWFALTELQPEGSSQPMPLLVTELPGAGVGLNWRNAAYALQWVVFAGFVLFFWQRFRHDLETQPAQQETSR